ncbi:MAG: cell wall-active antibiotics response protein [Anaerolineae bacterium]|nr:cell wall-active antibiotics response protein [Anaerolineae bacterium]
MDEKRSRGVSIFGPVILIAAGVVLLLNTLGIVEWSIWWTLLRLWPILLVAAGLDLLIGRRSMLGSLVATLLVLAILAVALWITLSGSIQLGGELRTEQISQALGDATQAEVMVDPGVGVLQIEALPEAANLVEGEINLAGGERIDQDFSVTGSRATYRLRTTQGSWGPFNWGWNDQRVWDLGLSPGATLALDADLGAGEAVLDLTGLTLSDLQVNFGLGRLEVTLPAAGRFEGSLEGAIGQTLIIVPEGMAVRIQADTGLASRDVPAGYQHEGDVITSPGYDTAENRADLQVSQAIGLLQIRAGE